MKLSKFGVADHYRANVQMEWPYICYGYVSWPPSELVPFLSYFATFPNFGALLFSQSKQIWNCRHLPWWCTGAGAMGVSFGGVMYPDHLKNLMCFDYILLIFLILVCFRSVTLGKFRDADNYLGNVQRGWPGFYYVYVSWSPSDQVAFLSGFIEFFKFWCNFIPSTLANLEFLTIILRMYRRNGLEFAMVMYFDHLQHWFHCDYILLIFFVLV